MTKEEKDIARQILVQIEMMQKDQIIIIKEVKETRYRIESVGFLLAVVAILILLVEFA